MRFPAVAVLSVSLSALISTALAQTPPMAPDIPARFDSQIPDAAALAAAGELDGSAAGVTRALGRAAAVAASFHYDYARSVTWDAAAIRFGTHAAHTGDKRAAGPMGAAVPRSRGSAVGAATASSAASCAWMASLAAAPSA